VPAAKADGFDRPLDDDAYGLPKADGLSDPVCARETWTISCSGLQTRFPGGPGGQREPEPSSPAIENLVNSKSNSLCERVSGSEIGPV
jgi:hypothetical protein